MSLNASVGTGAQAPRVDFNPFDPQTFAADPIERLPPVSWNEIPLPGSSTQRFYFVASHAGVRAADAHFSGA